MMTELFFSEQLDDIARAKAICAECPVIDSCLQSRHGPARAMGRVGRPALCQRQDPGPEAQTGPAPEGSFDPADGVTRGRPAAVASFRVSEIAPRTTLLAGPSSSCRPVSSAWPATIEGMGRPSPAVLALADAARLIPVCPETAGGLPTPRPAAELGSDGLVRTEAGDDVTDAYRRGAAHTVAVAVTAGAALAVLKARSPSCGCHEVYDGTFSRALRTGEGLTAAALRHAGIQVLSEEDLDSA